MLEPNPDFEDTLIGLTPQDRKRAIELIPLVYEDLRGLAASYLRQERPDHTLQPTALVHDAFLRLAHRRQDDYYGRTHFFRVAARVMRRILVDHANSRRSRTRLRDQEDLDEPRIDLEQEQQVNVLALNEALDRLGQIDARKVQLVELRYFAGLTLEDAADVLGISLTTANRDWAMAKAWLLRALSGPGTAGDP